MTDDHKSPPEFIQRWSRRVRVLVASVAIILTCVVLVPAAILAIGYLIGAGDCEASSDAIRCSALGKSLTAGVIIAIVLPPSLVWARFLQRILNYRENNDRAPPGVF